MAKDKEEPCMTPEALAALKENIRAEILAEQKDQADREQLSADQARIRAMEEAKKDLVEIELFQDDDKYSGDVFVGVNGIRYKIKRGERVQVPRFVAEVLEQSAAQDRSTASMISRREAEYRNAAQQNFI